MAPHDINGVLRVLGVRATGGADEFDVVGLGRYRRSPDRLDHYLASAFRPAGGTVVLVRVERPNVVQQPPGSGFVAEMQPRDGDVVVVKRTVGAFYGTGLADRLRERDIDTVVMTGLATTMGVESTARAAADHGFAVIFVADAMSGMTAAEHEHALATVLPRFGDVYDTEQLLARLRSAGDRSAP